MCVVPSIIVLLITALVVFRRELIAPPAAPASKHPPIATRSNGRAAFEKPRRRVHRESVGRPGVRLLTR